jgi:hypothetical protein
MASGTPIDLGGAWLHGVPTNPLTSIVDRLDFTRRRTDLSTPFYTPRGRAPAEEQRELAEALAEFEERVEAGSLRARAAHFDDVDGATPRSPCAVEPSPTSTSSEPGTCLQCPNGDRASDYLPCGHARYFDLIRANAGPLESTAELDETSTVDASEFASGEDDLVVEGLGKVVEKLGQEVLAGPSGIAHQLGARVTGIQYDDGGVRVTAMEDAAPVTYSGRRVLVTVSTGVLGRAPKEGGITFEPPLPREKLDAIKGLPMGVMNKVVLEWDADVLGDEVPENAWVLYRADTKDAKGHAEVMAFVLRPFGSRRIAIGFFGGERAKAFEALCKPFVDAGRFAAEDPTPRPCDEPAVKTAREALHAMFPTADVAGHDPRAYVTRWGLVSWTRGAYSAAQPDKWTMHEELAKPVPFPSALYAAKGGDHTKQLRVFFAGEGCARSIYNGSFPGAYESGMVAAREIAASLAAE